MNNIPGYMSIRELEVLSQIFSKFNTGVEIGSLHGRSSYAIAKAISGTLYCIDGWDGFDSSSDNFTLAEKIANDFPLPGIFCTLEFFKENTKECSNIIPIKGKSPEVIKNWDNVVDFIFLDALHTNPSDWDNIEFWLRRIRIGGILAGHDYYSDRSQWPDVYDNVKLLENTYGKVNNPIGTSIWLFNV